MQLAHIILVVTIGIAAGCAPSRSGTMAESGAPLPQREPVLAHSSATDIDSIALAFLAEGRAAGFSVGIGLRDEILFARGYGWADVEQGVPATSETVYRIGSLTKPITAAAILRLAERGRLNLNSAIGTVFPDYPSPGRAITFRQLLNMTSGIPNYTTDSRLDYFRADLSHDSVIALFSSRPLTFDPGSRYDYSNSNYYLLGVAIERLSGMRYEEYVRDSILGPLELDDTRYCSVASIIPRRASGYRRVRDTLARARPIEVAWAFAAGGYCSTVVDQVRWVRALASARAISAESFANMASKTSLTGGTESGYGLGLAVDELRGRRQLSHAGNLDGFQASYSYFPDDSLAVVVLSNTEQSGASELKERIARHLLGIRPLTRADVSDLPLTEEQRRRYVGSYALETVSARFNVIESGDRLQLSFAGQPPVDLLHQGRHRFLPANDLETSFSFMLDGEVAVRSVVRSATGNEFLARRELERQP